ncbi:MAG: hypothetical protein VB122_01040 [Erysipelotrichales bacterium]|nr:hypothetical protein [Erysipelotrichales bacterium]
MQYRFGKKNDISRIAYLHHKVRQTYDMGFFSTVKKSFLKEYYKILISDPNEIILCAEDDNGIIQGFCSGSLNVTKQKQLLNKNKWKLGFALIPTIINKPKILLEGIKRYKSITTNSKLEEKFIINEGARSEYWTWNNEEKDSESSVVLLNKFYNILFILGCKEVNFEVDLCNKKVYKFHLYNGAELMNTFTLSDGRERAILKYNLEIKFKS